MTFALTFLGGAISGAAALVVVLLIHAHRHGLPSISDLRRMK